MKVESCLESLLLEWDLSRSIAYLGVCYRHDVVDRTADRDGEVWPISIIGITKELNVERDLKSIEKQRIEYA